MRPFAIFDTIVKEIRSDDADGNMTSDGRFSYVWNAENRLIRAQELYAPTNRAPYTVAYAYDHRGRMVSKRITENDGSNSPISILHSTFVWDDWNIIREIVREGSSATVTDNVWGLDLDGTFQGAGGVGGLLAVVRSDCVTTNSSTPNSSTHQLFFPTYDANGNVSEYVSTNGEIVAHYDYSPFGEILVQSGDFADTFTHRFSTKPWCPITGLYEYQMRKYRPEIGRWLSRDPADEDGGVGIYCYCSNDGNHSVDVAGLAIKIINKTKNLSARRTHLKTRGEVLYSFRVHVRCSLFGERLKVSGEFKLEMNILHAKHRRWSEHFPRYDRKWGSPRTNAREREAAIAHENDHWDTFMAFEKALVSLNNRDGTTCCNCRNWARELENKIKEIYNDAQLHSQLFDTKLFWNGGRYGAYPFIPDDLPQCQ